MEVEMFQNSTVDLEERAIQEEKVPPMRRKEMSSLERNRLSDTEVDLGGASSFEEWLKTNFLVRCMSLS